MDENTMPEKRRTRLRLAVDLWFEGRQRQFAIAVERSHSQISEMLKGTRVFGERLARDFERILELKGYPARPHWFDGVGPAEGVSPGQNFHVLRGETVERPQKKVAVPRLSWPQINLLGAGGRMDLREVIQDPAIDWTTAPHDSGAEFAITAVGDSMVSLGQVSFPEGTVLYMSTTRPYRSGDFVIALDPPTQRFGFRQLIYHATHWTLSPLNGAHGGAIVGVDDLRVLAVLVRAEHTMRF